MKDNEIAGGSVVTSRREVILTGWSALPCPKPTHAIAAEVIGCTPNALTKALSLARLEGLDVDNRVDVELVLDEWEFLRCAGTYWEHAARRLNLSVYTFGKILLDARSAGDGRGYLTIEDADNDRRRNHAT